MRLNLKKIGVHGQDSLAFQTALDLSAARRWGEHPIPKPVDAHGTVRGQNGVFTLRYTARFELATRCARCLEDIRLPVAMEFSHIVVEELADESADDLVLAPDGELELDELIAADILLELPDNSLCAPGCKGICPVCGQNRNLSGCGCETAAPDSRFQKLRDWMQQQNPTD